MPITRLQNTLFNQTGIIPPDENEYDYLEALQNAVDSEKNNKIKPILEQIEDYSKLIVEAQQALSSHAKTDWKIEDFKGLVQQRTSLIQAAQSEHFEQLQARIATFSERFGANHPDLLMAKNYIKPYQKGSLPDKRELMVLDQLLSPLESQLKSEENQTAEKSQTMPSHTIIPKNEMPQVDQSELKSKIEEARMIIGRYVNLKEERSLFLFQNPNINDNQTKEIKTKLAQIDELFTRSRQLFQGHQEKNDLEGLSNDITIFTQILDESRQLHQQLQTRINFIKSPLMSSPTNPMYQKIKTILRQLDDLDSQELLPYLNKNELKNIVQSRLSQITELKNLLENQFYGEDSKQLIQALSTRVLQQNVDHTPGQPSFSELFDKVWTEGHPPPIRSEKMRGWMEFYNSVEPIANDKVVTDALLNLDIQKKKELLSLQIDRLQRDRQTLNKTIELQQRKVSVAEKLHAASSAMKVLLDSLEEARNFLNSMDVTIDYYQNILQKSESIESKTSNQLSEAISDIKKKSELITNIYENFKHNAVIENKILDSFKQKMSQLLQIIPNQKITDLLANNWEVTDERSKNVLIERIAEITQQMDLLIATHIQEGINRLNKYYYGTEKPNNAYNPVYSPLNKAIKKLSEYYNKNVNLFETSFSCIETNAVEQLTKFNKQQEEIQQKLEALRNEITRLSAKYQFFEKHASTPLFMAANNLQSNLSQTVVGKELENIHDSYSRSIHKVMTSTDQKVWLKGIKDAQLQYVSDLIQFEEKNHKLLSKSGKQFIDTLRSTESTLLREVKPNYKDATLGEGRWHYDAVSPTAALKDELKKLKGDALKTRILLDFKTSLESIDNEEQLNRVVSEFKNSPEYKILQTAQGKMTRWFTLDTSSVKAVNAMITEKEREIKESPNISPK